MSQRWASLCYNLGVETKLLRHKRRKNVILYFRKSEILLFISHSLKTERPKLHTLAFYNMSQHLFIHRGLYTRIAFWWISTPQRSPRQFIFFIIIFFSRIPDQNVDRRGSTQAPPGDLSCWVFDTKHIEPSVSNIEIFFCFLKLKWFALLDSHTCLRGKFSEVFFFYLLSDVHILYIPLTL